MMHKVGAGEGTAPRKRPRCPTPPAANLRGRAARRKEYAYWQWVLTFETYDEFQTRRLETLKQLQPKYARRAQRSIDTKASMQVYAARIRELGAPAFSGMHDAWLSLYDLTARYKRGTTAFKAAVSAHPWVSVLLAELRRRDIVPRGIVSHHGSGGGAGHTKQFSVGVPRGQRRLYVGRCFAIQGDSEHACAFLARDCVLADSGRSRARKRSHLELSLPAGEVEDVLTEDEM